MGYTIGNSPDGNDTIELSLSSQIDLSLDHLGRGYGNPELENGRYCGSERKHQDV